MDQRHLLMHQAMLGDRERLAAYDRALAQTLRPGAVIADVGAGTLVLTALALSHGAAHVYAIEADPEMAVVGQQLIEANGWQRRVTLVQGDARLVRLPQRLDLVVSEMMGNLGPEEGLCRVLGAVVRHNLRPGGAVIPQQLLTSFAPAQLDGEGWGIWTQDFLGMRLDAVQHLLEPRAHLHFFTRRPTLLAEPAVVASSPGAAANPHVGVLPELTVQTPGQLHAVLGYFTAVLAPGVTLSNFPSYPGCNWAVWVWPLRHTTVAAGDVLRLTVISGDADRLVTDWKLDCHLLRKKAA